MTRPWTGTGGIVPLEATAVLDEAGLDALLINAAVQGASDVILQTGSVPVAERNGARYPARVPEQPLGDAALTMAISHLYGRSAPTQLAARQDLNCAHAARAPDGSIHRFRVNITPALFRHAVGVNVVIRPLPADLPELDELDVEPELAAALLAGTGLSVVTGVPGSGKSTLLAAVIRRLAEARRGRIQTYEAPVEFVYHRLAGTSGLVSQTEVPTHLRDFATGVRASLRRSPFAILVGEARDRATVEAVIDAADFGIATYTTTHALGVANTVRRFLTEFEPAEREARAIAMLDTLNVVVTQALVPDGRGTRAAAREWLVFDPDLKAQLADHAPARWSGLIARRLAGRDRTLAAAIRRVRAKRGRP